jgi:endoglucanase
MKAKFSLKTLLLITIPILIILAIISFIAWESRRDKLNLPLTDILPGGEINESDLPLTGMWMGSRPSAEKGNIEYYNKLLGQQIDIIHTFVGTFQDSSEWTDFMDYVHSQGALNLLTIETKREDYSDYSTADINNGTLDEYFTKLAIQMKSWQNGSEVWLRLLHEGNGNWSGWALGDSKVNTNTSYKKAFQRIVNIFRSNGATNVKFVYNVNYSNSGAGASYMGAYPGDDYVDYVSIDGYNWGTTQDWSSWESFRKIFDKPYQALTKGSSKPVIIAEFASTEKGGDKAAWIIDMKEQIQSGAYPRLFALVWFNEDKETDWRIQSSPSSLVAFRTAE